MGKLKVGFIGCGEIAVHHAKSLAATPNAQLVVAMDTVESLAKDLAEKYGARWTTNADVVLDDPEVDAVYIATPHSLHASYAVQAAEKGKHVMCEKPIATTLEDADRMIAAARAAGTKLSICYVLRFEKRVEKVRSLVRAGVIGEPIGVFLSALFYKPESYWQQGWSGRVKTDWRMSKAKSGGGITIMNLSHDIDFVVSYVLDLRLTRIFSQYGTFTTPVEVEDLLIACGRLSNGAVLHLEASSCALGGRGNPSRILGTRGQIILSNPLQLYTRQDFDGLKRDEWNEIKVEQPYDSRAKFIEEFARAVLEGGDAPIPGEEGRRALEIVCSAYRSGETNRVVEL